ncbi:hypothetical protein AciM339_0915 [Aciduliprofundum sp. MAR08-339]|uniref:zinc ribbon domain-containing protein n=1 Tax=Aciduliprofundum sp. (strain MAR08-339) TaxID=673860 RepID=UPI0002A47DA0|nr:hypothetical protein AciM339_0915 [Aciduliprofundum sp. MAR08-339]
MNSVKIAVLLVFVLGMTLVVLGGVFNPYTEVVNLPEGGFRGIGFRMYGGEVVSYNLTSFHTFTVYIMSKSEFYKLLNNGTFNGSYYTQTGRAMELSFSVPKTGIYYIVIANFNSKTAIEVDLTFKKTLNWPLAIAGSLIVILSTISLLFVIHLDTKKPPRDSQCPNCKREVSSRWRFCPYCRYELGGEKDEN